MVELHGRNVCVIPTVDTRLTFKVSKEACSKFLHSPKLISILSLSVVGEVLPPVFPLLEGGAGTTDGYAAVFLHLLVSMKVIERLLDLTSSAFLHASILAGNRAGLRELTVLEGLP